MTKLSAVIVSDQLFNLVVYFLNDLICLPVSCRHIVGLAGSPGAGKSTVASEIVLRVNKLWFKTSYSFDSQVEPPVVATVLPMDGFHLYRHQLDEMEVVLPFL